MQDKPPFEAPAGFGIVSMDALSTKSGLEIMRDIIAGKLPAPPISKTLSFWMTEAEEGRAVFRGVPKHEYLNPLGTIHGGWSATVMDSALACAVQTTLKLGEAYTTTEFKVNLIRPITPETGEVVCEGKVVSRGRTIAVSECRLMDDRGRIMAFGTETCSIFPVSALKRG